jgi:RNA-directed DNA polymerase
MGTSGSEGGPEKRAGSNPGTALRLDPYWRIQRHRKRGTSRYYVYTYPSRKAVKAVTTKVKTIFRRNVNQPLQTLIRQVNPALRGWCAYFRPGVSAATFSALARYTRDRFWRWARRKHRRITMKTIRRRYCNGGWWPVTTEIALFNPDTMHTTRYRYRGAAIPAPWPARG